jgi:hypothetical protein
MQGARELISSAFSFFLLHKHLIDKKKSFSGEVKDSVIFPFFFFFIRELNPHPPLVFPLTYPRELKTYTSPYTHPSAHPSTHTSHTAHLSTHTSHTAHPSTLSVDLPGNAGG